MIFIDALLINRLDDWNIIDRMKDPIILYPHKFGQINVPHVIAMDYGWVGGWDKILFTNNEDQAKSWRRTDGIAHTILCIEQIPGFGYE